MNLEDIKEQHLLEISNMLRALSEPTRLKIMQNLHQSEMNVGQLVDALGTSQANISKHLKILSIVNLVKSRREGTTIFYSLFDPCIHNLCESICGNYFQLLEKRLKSIA